MNRFRWALGISAALAASAAAGDLELTRAGGHFFHPKKPVPSTPYRPIEPRTVDPKVDPKIDPKVDPKKDPEPKVDPLDRAPEAGTQAAESFNPNMFGDMFGAQQTRLTVTSTRQFQQVLTDGTGRAVPYRPITNTPNLQQTPGTFIVVQDNNRRSNPFRANFQATTPIRVTGGNKTLLENSAFTQVLRSLNPGSTVTFLPQQSQALQTNRGNPPQGIPPIYVIQPGYQITTVMTTDAALPLGGVVGRQKVSEDNNPTPGDRVILNYDTYANTLLAPGGYDVYRFAVGGELSGFGGAASAQVVLPFASTLDPVASSGGIATRDTVIGDLTVIGKVLVIDGFDYDVATGVGVAIPTAPDAVLQGPAGNDVLRIRNQSYFVTPFIAGSYLPTERVFTQAWLQISYDTTGSQVQTAPNGTGPLINSGRIYDPALLQADFQLGYWAVQDPGFGVAPYVELHYNRPIGDGTTPAGGGVTLGGRRSYNELNLSFGAAVVVDSFYLNVGLAIPLRDGPDKFFDYQFGIRANYMFGPGRGTGVPPGPGSRPPGL